MDVLTSRKRYTFWIDERQASNLETVRQRDGILPSEQIRRALDDWFVKRDVKPEAARRRVSPRRRT